MFILLLIYFFLLGISQQSIPLLKRARYDGTHPEMILRQCREGNLEYLNRFFAETPDILSDSPLADQCFRLAIKHNHPPLVTLLIERFGVNDPQMRWALTKALKKRNLNMIRTLVPLDYFQDFANHQILRFAHTSMLWRFLYNQVGEMGSLGICTAGRFGALEFLQSQAHFLREYFQFSGSIIRNAANEGHLHILRWIIDEEGPLYTKIMETGLLREDHINSLIQLISIIESNNLVNFKNFFAERRPRFLWQNYLSSALAASSIQVCLVCDAHNIFNYLIDSICKLHMALPNSDHSSLMYLQASFSSAVCQSSNRPAVIKRILQSTLPACISKQFFVLEALPEALDVFLLQSVSVAFDSWSEDELNDLFMELGFGIFRTKLQVLQGVCRDIKAKNIQRLLVFMDKHPHLTDMHDFIWHRLFFDIDGFFSFINAVSCTKP